MRFIVAMAFTQDLSGGERPISREGKRRGGGRVYVARSLGGMVKTDSMQNTMRIEAAGMSMATSATGDATFRLLRR